jgi:hypothetical protein
MKSESDIALREHIRDLLRGGDAHVHVPEVVGDFPPALVNMRIGNLPYTPWHVLEHMRIAQWDILEFSRNEKHVSPKFPEGYWPEAGKDADSGAWQKSVEAFLFNLQEMEELVMNSSTDLFAPIPHGDGQTILREALLVADHNAYHLGSLMTMKKAGLVTE